MTNEIMLLKSYAGLCKQQYSMQEHKVIFLLAKTQSNTERWGLTKKIAQETDKNDQNRLSENCYPKEEQGRI